MNKSIATVARLNLKNNRVPFLVTGIVVATQVIQAIIKIIISVNTGNVSDEIVLSMGLYFWLLPLMAAVFIPAMNFRRIVNLGGKRVSFFWGSLLTELILVLSASLINLACFFVVDLPMRDAAHFSGVVNLLTLFGWISNGVAVAFLQQTAFLLLVTVTLHTLTAAQDKWYGWAADLVIAAILSVFIPIAPLRAVLLSFFDLIIFHANAWVQIACCLVLSAAIYALNKPILARKVL